MLSTEYDGQVVDESNIGRVVPVFIDAFRKLGSQGQGQLVRFLGAIDGEPNGEWGQLQFWEINMGRRGLRGFVPFSIPALVVRMLVIECDEPEEHWARIKL